MTDRSTADASTSASRDRRVPPPVPPQSADAWYAPAVRTQREVHPGVVATVRETGRGFRYDVREPVLGPAGDAAIADVRAHFSTANHRRPLTREGVVERADRGFEPKYRTTLDRLLDVPPGTRRRVDYHALCHLRLLGDVTPLALDDHIDVADVGTERGRDEPRAAERDAGDRIVVHTDDFAPATTEYAADAEYAARVGGERLARYAVDANGFDVDVVLYHEHVLGNDQFDTKYAVLEPDLLPGDGELIAECKDRIWEANVDQVVDDRRAFVATRARQFLSRRLTARNTRAWLDATRYRLRRALAAYDLALPPVDSRFAPDRLDDLVYYVLRDYVGDGILTVPIRDPHLEDIEANRVGERIKVVPRAETGTTGRIPTNLAFEDESAFVNVVTQLAARDGTELNASTPSAKVNVDPDGVEETIRCAVALPVISEGGPHVSIRKQSPDAMTAVDLLDRGSLSVELVTLLWMLYEHHGVVLFSGPTGVGKTTLMNAHMPFVRFDDRPVSIDEGSREVRVPHETGISLTTRDHENEYKRVSMADLMTEANYLNPDVEVIAEINTPASFETFASTLNTGHGVIGTTHAEDVETLVNRVVEQGVPAYLLREIDLVVFPRLVDGERYVGEVVELLSEREYEAVVGDRRDDTGAPGEQSAGVVEKAGATVYWNRVATRNTDGTFEFAYRHPDLGDASRRLGLRTLHRLAATTDRELDSVEAEFHRKRRYVEYVVREGRSGFQELYEFLADLRAHETAAVERAGRRRTPPTDEGMPLDETALDGGGE